MRWLLLSDEYPWPLHHGTYLRVFNLAKSLKGLGDEVFLLCSQSPDGQMGNWADIASDIFTADCTIRTQNSFYPVNGKLIELIANLNVNFDCAVCFHARSLAYGRTIAQNFSGKALIADLIDDYGLEQKRRLRSDLPDIIQFARRIKHIYEHGRYERRFLDVFNRYSFVGRSDADSFAARHNLNKARCADIANGVDTELFKPADISGQMDITGVKKLDGPSLVFPGRFIHPPNVEAAQYLVTKIAPVVRKIHPGLHVVLLGADPPESLQKLADKNVTVTGFVENLPLWLNNCDIATLSMKSGTGIKNKLLESWAAGLPVVATSLACQGSDGAADGENLLIADNHVEFAAAIVRLLADKKLCEKLTANGLQLVRSKYSWDSSAKKLQTLAQQILT